MGIDNLSVRCARKEARKNKKAMKKIGKVAFNQHKKIDEVLEEKFGTKKQRKKKRQKAKAAQKSEETDEIERDIAGNIIADGPLTTAQKKHIEKLQQEEEREQKRERRRAQKELIAEEEAEMKKYAKLLGYHKRKTKNIPKVFEAEGLADLLEICDAAKRREIAEKDKLEVEAGLDSDPEGNEDQEMDDMDIDLNEDSDIGDEDDLEMIDEEEEGDIVDEEEEEELEDEDEEDEIVEDIYGREVSKKTGKLIETNVKGAMDKLTQLEQKMDVMNSEDRLKLERNIRGIVNRLITERSMVLAIKSLREVFTSNGRNDVKQILFEALYKYLSTRGRLQDKILLENATFLALTHTSVSAEITCHFVEMFITAFVASVRSGIEEDDDKSLENQLIILCHLYNFKIIRGAMVFELLEILKQNVTARNLTLIMLALSYAGASFRKRDSTSLKSFIENLQLEFSKASDRCDNNLRVKFLMDEFLSIKNCNILKLTTELDATQLDHFQKLYRGLVKNVERKEGELVMSVDDILHIEERGRWWVVGSSWMPTDDGSMPGAKNASGLEGATRHATLAAEQQFDPSLLELARKAKMNTELRKTIFCTMMSSSDEADAFERLMKLSLKDQQEREIIHISILCVMREASYNAFYCALVDQFCNYHKRFKTTLQYAIWDRLRELSEFKLKQRSNFAYFIADLIRKEAIGLPVLKVVEFATIDPITSRTVKKVLCRLFLTATEHKLKEIFERVIHSKTHDYLSQALQLFLEMKMRNVSDDENAEQIAKKVQYVASLWERLE
uniref:MI domain-containing protein n=1 Tax=Steinernema glaseri TaxID=37863 RepID=A0A1I7ZZV2_9BILA